MEEKVTETPAPGANVSNPEIKPWSLEQIDAALKRDLNTAVYCLKAIMSDPDLLAAVAQFVHGRIENARHAQVPQSKA